MANITLNQYIKILSTAIHEYDGFGLADMLSLRDDHAINSNLFMINYHSATRTLPSPYDDLVAAHLQTLAACENKEWVSAFNHQVTTLDVFTKEFQQQKEENWCLPVMKELILDIRLLSIKGEEYAVVNKEKFKSGELIEQAAKSIMNVFRVCAGDTRTDINHSKRWGMLHVVNQLFKLYFRLNNFKLCKPLERAVNNSNLLDDFSIAQQVTYRYYVGRLKMFENDYTSAEEHLSFAHEKCFHLAEDNQRHILFYFITLRMLSGKMPTTRLLEKHNLQQFSEIATAVRIGNVRFFNSIMEKYEDFFIFRGIFLIVDKLRMLTYRNLFRRIAHILKTHQLPLKPFLNILHYLGEDDVDIDEIECIIANLIHQGYIKGYISHQHQKLVVSKANAFPKLSTFL